METDAKYIIDEKLDDYVESWFNFLGIGMDWEDHEHPMYLLDDDIDIDGMGW